MRLTDSAIKRIATILKFGISSKYGWITLEGSFIPSDPEKHGEAASEYFDGLDPELQAEQAGWVRVTRNFGVLNSRCIRPLNQAQQDTLFDYCTSFGLDYDKYVKESYLELE